MLLKYYRKVNDYFGMSLQVFLNHQVSFDQIIPALKSYNTTEINQLICPPLYPLHLTVIHPVYQYQAVFQN